MDIWESIVKLAVIGTERGEMPAQVKQALEELGIDTQQDSAEVLLKASTMLVKMRKAGYQPQSFGTKLPAAAPPSTQAICSLQSVRHLMLILNGAFKEVLPEFLNTLGEVNKRLPEEVLPDILDLGRTRPEQWELLRKIIGTRGEWLVQQNPDWQYIILHTDVENWETGSKPERIALLRYWRKNEPNTALQMLQSTWKYENINDKLDFLKVLNIGLSVNDEAFLEKSLDARRKEERKLAAKLLSKIPESQLVQRMYNRIRPLLTIQKKQLNVELPSELGEAAVRDGLDMQAQWMKGGLKASQLGQMLAIVPPHLLEEHFDKTPRKILELFWKSEWKELLFQALLESIAVHNHQLWTDYIFSFWLEKAEHEDLSDFINLEPLLHNISENLFNKIALMGLSNAHGLLEESHPVVQLLKQGTHPWQPKLTLAFTSNLQKWMKNAHAYWAGWHYKVILKKAAFYSSPDLLPQLENSWPTEERVWGFWEKEVEDFLKVLRFRRAMIQELHQ